MKEPGQARQISFPVVSPFKGDLLIDPVSSHNRDSFVELVRIGLVISWVGRYSWLEAVKSRVEIMI